MTGTTVKLGTAALGLTLALGLVACGGKAAPSDSTPTAGSELSPTTPAPTSTVDKVTWALYRDVASLDPIYAFDYPENTAVAAMCETLIRQQPDGTTVPGLASDVDSSDPTKIVFTLRDGVTFWDGKPLTPADVVYSLQRQATTTTGYYGTVYQNVTAIKATGPNTVTITLKQPDSTLLGELSSTPGFITEKAYTESKGAAFGTPTGGTMCTGAFQLKSWKAGSALVMTKYDGYWDTSYPRMVNELHLIGAPDEANLTQSLKTGEIDGVYPLQLSTLDELRADPNLNVYEGPSYATHSLILSNPSGTLGDPKVRQALSLAIDRQGIIDATWRGAAEIPHAVVGPGTFGYAQDAFQAAYDALPAMTPDLEQAKQLIADAGAEGKPITLGTSSELAPLQVATDAVKSAAEQIGLTVTEKSVSAAKYIDFFTDANARKGVDGFFTINYPDYADPLALYAPIAEANGFSNYFSYSNPSVDKALAAARAELDPDKRAQHVIDAQATIVQDLPWIPVALPHTIVIMNKRITGAPSSFQYMFGPWAAQLGGTG